MIRPTMKRGALCLCALSTTILLVAGCGDDDGAPPPLHKDGGDDDAGMIEGGLLDAEEAPDTGGGGSGGSGGTTPLPRDTGTGGDTGPEPVDAATDSGDAKTDAAVSDGDVDAGPDADTDGFDAAVPAQWLCPDSLWYDGYCDCGCGVEDLDCEAFSCAEPGCTHDNCDACFGLTGGWISCENLTWQCDEALYDDDFNDCDCGCGAPDPDCMGNGCIEPNCRTPFCDRRFDENHDALTDRNPPKSWTCPRDSYGGGDGCDCGCGATDPDCEAGGCTNAKCNSDDCDNCHDDFNRPITCTDYAGWQCDPALYGDGKNCNCGCGMIDPDCGGDGCAEANCFDAACDVCHGCPATNPDCNGHGIEGGIVPCNREVPEGWTCYHHRYGTGDGCDCGCGEGPNNPAYKDPDCKGGGYCTETGCHNAGCDKCHQGDPTWAINNCGKWSEECDIYYYDAEDGVCDCGCGSYDPDCKAAYCTEVDCEEPTCDYCMTTVLESEDGGGETVQRVECGTWTCNKAYYGNGGQCDCGCGALDPDCGDGGCVEPGCFDNACDVCVNTSGIMIRCYEWLCAEENYDDGVCDCGCGAPDPDCGDGGCLQPGCMEFSSCEVCRDPFGRSVGCP